MVKKLTRDQAGALGGKATWKAVKRPDRVKKMRALARKRWKNYKKKQLELETDFN